MKADTDLGPMVSAAQRAKVADQVEAAVGAGAEVVAGGGDGRQRAGALLRARRRHRRARRDRAAQRGDLRPRRAAGPGQEPRRGDRAGQLDALRARRQHLHPGLQDDPALHARGQGRHRLVQRPAHRQRRGAVRRLQAVGAGPRARPRGPRGLPGDQARPHRVRGRPEGVVVPLLGVLPRGASDSRTERRTVSCRTSQQKPPTSTRSSPTSSATPGGCTSPGHKGYGVDPALKEALGRGGDPARPAGRVRGDRPRARADAVPAGPGAGRRRLGGGAELVPAERRLGRQPRDLHDLRTRSRDAPAPARPTAARSSSSATSTRRRSTAWCSRDCAPLRRARDRSRPGDRPLRDARGAGARPSTRTRTREAVMLVSPTYFGAVARVAELAEVAHARGLPLVVDEAWGAHLYFHDALPAGALRGGADVVLSSTHKIVGSLTQSAILHLGRKELVDEGLLDRSVTLVESTSPNALLTASLDAQRRLRGDQGPGAADRDPRRRSLAPAERIVAIAGLRRARRAAGRPRERARLGPAAALGGRAGHRRDRPPDRRADARARRRPASSSTPRT